MGESGDVGLATIRLRVGVVVIEDGRILLVPHYDTDVGPVQWCIPGGRLELNHVDLYRLDPEEAAELGLEELMSGQAVTAVEWAERAEELLPEDRLEINLTWIGPQERRAVVDTVGQGASLAAPKISLVRLRASFQYTRRGGALTRVYPRIFVRVRRITP